MLIWRKCLRRSLAHCKHSGKSHCAQQASNLCNSKLSLRSLFLSSSSTVVAFFPAFIFLLLNFRVETAVAGFSRVLIQSRYGRPSRYTHTKVEVFKTPSLWFLTLVTRSSDDLSLWVVYIKILPWPRL